MRTILALVASVAVAASGVAEPDGFRMDQYRAPVPETIRGGSVVHVNGLAKLLVTSRVVLIDVLPAPRPPPDAPPGRLWLPVPHRDVPGSLWLPDVGRGAISPALDARFRSVLAQATKGDFAHPVVFYCLSACWMSWNAARRAIGYGYRKAIWFPDGADGWAAAGMRTEIARPLAVP